MIRKPALIAILIFLVLGSAALFLEKRGSDIHIGKVTPTPTDYKVMTRTDKDVKKARLATRSQEIVVEADPQTGWKVLSPSAVSDGASTFQEKIMEITSLRVMQVLDPTSSDSTLGVDQPSLTISLEFINGSNERILIGNPTPIGNGYYARLQNGDAVVLNKYSVDNVMDIFNQFYATPTPAIQPGTPVATP